MLVVQSKRNERRLAHICMFVYLLRLDEKSMWIERCEWPSVDQPIELITFQINWSMKIGENRVWENFLPDTHTHTLIFADCFFHQVKRIKLESITSLPAELKFIMRWSIDVDNILKQKMTFYYFFCLLVWTCSSSVDIFAWKFSATFRYSDRAAWFFGFDIAFSPLMDCTVVASLRNGSQFSLPSRACAHTHTNADEHCQYFPTLTHADDDEEEKIYQERQCEKRTKDCHDRAAAVNRQEITADAWTRVNKDGGKLLAEVVWFWLFFTSIDFLVEVEKFDPRNFYWPKTRLLWIWWSRSDETPTQ